MAVSRHTCISLIVIALCLFLQSHTAQAFSFSLHCLPGISPPGIPSTLHGSFKHLAAQTSKQLLFLNPPTLHSRASREGRGGAVQTTCAMHALPPLLAPFSKGKLRNAVLSVHMSSIQLFKAKMAFGATRSRILLWYRKRNGPTLVRDRKRHGHKPEYVVLHGYSLSFLSHLPCLSSCLPPSFPLSLARSLAHSLPLRLAHTQSRSTTFSLSLPPSPSLFPSHNAPARSIPDNYHLIISMMAQHVFMMFLSSCPMRMGSCLRLDVVHPHSSPPSFAEPVSTGPVCPLRNQTPLPAYSVHIVR